ncbi:MAG: hypothetical protein Tsb006_4060 [Rickettsiaceae bacterium]
MNDLIYLFEITLANGQKHYLTSAAESKAINSATYLPNSGLSIVSGVFNDSAQNHIIIHGIFEHGGIKKSSNLSGALVKIKYLTSDEVKPLACFSCSKYLSKDLEFEMHCEAETVKYNQSLLQMFSKTCRANFGDNKCKVSLSEVAVNCRVISVVGNMLKCDFQGASDGYFKGGKLIASDEAGISYEFKILSHSGDNIEINLNDSLSFSEQKEITLIPGCDKNYRTCCYSFNNAVNFRGEPAIPEYNVIEN